MSVYIGTCNYGADEAETNESSNGNPSEISEIDGDLDMQNYRIVILQQSG